MTTIDESVIADRARAYLLEQGWEVFPEVQIHAYDRRADLVARKDGKIWVVECKRRLSMAVTEQAVFWLYHRYADKASVAVHSYSPRSADLLRMMKPRVGLLKVWSAERDVHVSFGPESISEQRVDDLANALCEHHKTYGEAGKAGGAYYTPYRHTCAQAAEFAEGNPRCTVQDVVRGIHHHYRSRQTAVQCIRKAFQGHDVPGFRLDESQTPYVVVRREQ